MFKRLIDIIVALIFLIILTPLFLVIAILIKTDSAGPVFYLQQRVGLNNSDFAIFKFRTMHTDADKMGLLTIGERDPRVTKVGYLLRKYKFDELPQLINVVIGNMSLVGPRPEVRKYVSLYNQEQLRVLSIKPGITDYASIEYSNENELLSQSENPEATYIEKIMPAKLVLNLKYINEQSFFTDIKIMWKTILKIIN